MHWAAVYLSLKKGNIEEKGNMAGYSKSEHLEKNFSLRFCILEQWNVFLT